MRFGSKQDTHSEVTSIPNEQPGDIQNHVQYVEDEHRVVQRVGHDVQVVRAGLSRYASEGIDQPGGLPEIDDTPDAERPTCVERDRYRPDRAVHLPAGVNSVGF